MAVSVEQVLKQQAQIGADTLKQSLINNGRNASGGTVSSVKGIATISPKMLIEIIGSEVIFILKDGRQPTGKGQGGGGKKGSFLEDIRAWVRSKGIPIEAAYPIYKKINEEGYKGTPTLFDGLDRWLDNLIDNILPKMVKEQALKEIRESINKFDR